MRLGFHFSLSLADGMIMSEIHRSLSLYLDKAVFACELSHLLLRTSHAVSWAGAFLGICSPIPGQETREALLEINEKHVCFLREQIHRGPSQNHRNTNLCWMFLRAMKHKGALHH